MESFANSVPPLTDNERAIAEHCGLIVLGAIESTLDILGGGNGVSEARMQQLKQIIVAKPETLYALLGKALDYWEGDPLWKEYLDVEVDVRED